MAVVAEELQLLAAEHGEPAEAAVLGSCRSQPRFLAAALTAAALTAVLAISHTPAAAVRDAPTVRIRGEQAFEGLAEAQDVQSWTTHRKKLAVESDLSQYVTEDSASLPPDALPSSAGGGASTLSVAAGNLFHYIVTQSGASGEMTAAELTAFKQRFIKSVVGSAGANKWWVQDYLGTAKRQIDATKPVMTEAIAASVNAAQTGFTVRMEDWMLDESVASFQNRLGRTPFNPRDSELKGHVLHSNLGERTTRDEDLPESFDAREKWPRCRHVIGKIHEQGECRDSWVFAATAPLDSRLCIRTDGGFSGRDAVLSRGFAGACSVTANACNGGWEYFLYHWLGEHQGLVTTRCSPYPSDDDLMQKLSCPTKCHSSYPRTIEEDSFDLKGVHDWEIVFKPDAAGIFDFKREMYLNGPLSFGVYVGTVFWGYTSGIYDEVCGEQPNHAIHAIGWGAGFILGQNSWGNKWGDLGRVKVALCVPTDFTIPGKIVADQFPLPLP